MPTQQFMDAVEAAARETNWYAALALALALPDICGRLENPTMGSEKRYVVWWDRYLLPKYTSNLPGPDKKTHSHVFLSGQDSYALRCAFLHEGSDDVLNQRARNALAKFHFTKPPLDKDSSVHKNQNHDVLQLQVDMFCHDICGGVEQWIKDTQGNQDIQSRMNALLVIHDISEEGGLVRVVTT